jgi:thiamine-phosphate pyrophosphorylase
MISGLYAVTPELTDNELLARQVEAALAGGARIVQYRDKSAQPSVRLAQAQSLRALCTRYDAALIINDDVDLADAVRADGVHLGRDDADIPSARSRLGVRALIGASCYNDLARALQAAGEGANYIAFGSVFPSPTKPGAVHAPLALFARARALLGLPLVAIGGITLANARQVIDAGADSIAVLSALFDADDVRAAAAAFSQLFPTLRRQPDPAYENP